MRPNPIPPGPGQESVWDYPRPPRIEDTTKRIRVIFNGELIADTRRSKRGLETSHPPCYYIPPEDIKMEYLIPSNYSPYCEWRGYSKYYHLKVGDRQAENVAWYRDKEIHAGYEEILGYVGFDPRPMDACYVDDEKAQPQQGNFYTGWITSDVVGPFKGGPGTSGW